MSKPLILGLGGYLASGKDVVADYLVEKHNFVKLGMSDPLHAALEILDPICIVLPDEQKAFAARGIHLQTYERYKTLTWRVGYTEAKTIEDYRRYLQVFGTDVGRDMIDQNIWVNYARNTIQDIVAGGQNAVLTATRYPNEKALIENMGGSTWWINRPSQKGKTAHSSDNSLDPQTFDRLIPNHTTFHDLYEAVDQALAVEATYDRS